MFSESTLGYVLDGNSPLSIAGGIEGLAFTSTKYANTSEDYPDIQMLFSPVSLINDIRQLKRAHGLTDDFYDKTFKRYENQYCWSIYPILLRPRSKGKVMHD